MLGILSVVVVGFVIFFVGFWFWFLFLGED
jgi:hypothetical protein